MRSDAGNLKRVFSSEGLLRPVYPYPAWTKYKGSGDPSKAENFVAVTP